MELKLSNGVVVTLKEKLKALDRSKIRIAKGVIDESEIELPKEKKKTEKTDIDIKEAMAMIVERNEEAKFVAIECFLTKAVDDKEVVIEHDRDFINELDLEDFDKIFESITPLFKKAIQTKKK